MGTPDVSGKIANMHDFAGQQVIVCGAGRGIGRACALAFAQAGASVCIISRTEADLLQVAELGRKNFAAEIQIVVGDLTTDAGREALFEKCPQPEILITNSGGPKPGNFQKFEREDWLQAFDENMVSLVLLIKEAAQRMTLRKYGRIVNITSSAVKAPLPFLALSNAARSAFTSAVAGLARELAPQGITINNVLPGPTDTERLRSNFEYRASKSGVAVEDLMEETLKKIPCNRFGKPEEVAHAVMMFAHKNAGFITSQNLLVDGGAFPGAI